jgi:predicted Rossmann-fold nucleotide-binding protein
MNSVLTMAVNDSPITAVKTKQPLIALYCAHEQEITQSIEKRQLKLAQGIAEQGFGLVYGGASIGLMGQVAESVLANGGEAVRGDPEFMLDYEVAHAGLTEFMS